MSTQHMTELAQERFLRAFAECGLVTHAARAAGVSRACVYAWQEHSDEFVARFREAEATALETAERELWRRAVEGWEKPVYQNGRQVGTIREYSDSLLALLLRSRKREIYGERVDVQHSGMTAKAYQGIDLARMLLPPASD